MNRDPVLTDFIAVRASIHLSNSLPWAGFVSYLGHTFLLCYLRSLLGMPTFIFRSSKYHTTALALDLPYSIPLLSLMLSCTLSRFFGQPFVI